MVIPSFYNSLHDPEVYPSPDDFNPERWLDSAGPANVNPKNYLVYGSGPHRCIGIEYANMNIALVLATAVAMMDFEHDRTELSDKIESVLHSMLRIYTQSVAHSMIATIFPKDGCRLTMTPRKHST
jgi:C-22 sterol desaturase